MPFDRPRLTTRRERPQQVRPQEAVARLARALAATTSWRSVGSAIGARIELLPHQLEPALAFLGGVRRVLLADEVGLGKTIQAGLVIAELARRQPSIRVMILVPASLQWQWQDELSSRFHLPAQLGDQTHLGAGERSGAFGDNPWCRPGIWITSVDYLKQPHVAEALPPLPWDLVVIDEAHDVSGDSRRYEASQLVARSARRVLLLTATPHSGDQLRFRRLRSLGELALPGDTPVVFRRTRTNCGEVSPRRVRWHLVGLSPAEQRLLDGLAAFERVLMATRPSAPPGAILLLSVLRKRALSTVAAFDRSLVHRLAWLDEPDRASSLNWLQRRFQFDEHAEDDVGLADREGLTAETGMAHWKERSWLRRLRAIAASAIAGESKLGRLLALARRSREPLVAFTEFRDSLRVAADALATVRTVIVLHGGQSPLERRAALGRFLHGEVTALVATDVAAQGLNLQTRARWLVNLELPWNPARLEQRIGRVDRLGQTRPVHVTLLVARHEAEAGLLSRMARRALAAQRALGHDILRDVTPPAASAIATALAEGRSDIAVAPTPDQPVVLAGRWTRPARVHALHLARLRHLSRRWRGPDPAEGRPTCTFLPRLPQFHANDPGAIALFLVPILDATGTLVELRAVAVRLARAGAGPVPTSRLVEARLVAAAEVRARCRRVGRLVDRLSQRAIEVESAIAVHLHEDCYAAEVQPGLFARRAEKAFDAARQRARLVLDAATARARSEKARAALEVGHPALHSLLLSRP